MADFHPQWLPRSGVPLTIVCGPPCSGKTTYVEKHAAPDDTIIDLDEIMREIEPAYRHWAKYETDGELLAKAVAVRNKRLAGLAKLKSGRAWFIVGAPTEAERLWWKDSLGGEVVFLHPGVEECRRRAGTRGTPYARHGVERWQLKSSQPWQPTERKRSTVTGLDGWPTQ